MELDEKQVYLEKLSYYKTVQPIMLFEREFQDGLSIISFNTSVVKVSSVAKEKISIECLKNMSFFAARGQVNTALPIIDEARDWMRNNIMPYIGRTTQLFNYA